MLFTLVTMTKASIYYTSITLHPQSSVVSPKCYSADMGLDNSSVMIPNIDPLPSMFFTSMIWGDVTRDEIDVRVEFTRNWVTSVSSFIT